MNINLTLVVQMVVFVVLIWFTMKVVWPMILDPMEERSKKIAAGLAAGDKGQQELAQARDRAGALLPEARERATPIVEQAQRQGNDLGDQANGTSTSQGARLVAQAK